MFVFSCAYLCTEHGNDVICEFVISASTVHANFLRKFQTINNEPKFDTNEHRVVILSFSSRMYVSPLEGHEMK
jgi:hypothetical protein